MKDESKGRIISQFIGLKSKMYSLISVDDEEVRKAKGVNKKNRRKEFVDVLFNQKLIKLCKIICKISLSCLDDKRYILDNGINSLTYKRLAISWFVFIRLEIIHKIGKSIRKLI